MLAVFEAASGEKHGHVLVVVAGGIAQVGGHEDHRLIQHGVGLQAAQEAAPFVDHALFHDGKLAQLFLVHAVVAEAVVAFIHAIQSGDRIACDMQGDKAGGVRGEGQVNDVQVDALHSHLVVAGDLGGSLGIHLGLGFADPLLIGDEALLQVPHAGEPGVQFVPVPGTDFTHEGLGLGPDHVHDAAPAADQFGLAVLLGGVVVNKKFGEELHRVVLRRNHGPVLGIGGAALTVGVEHQGRETSLVAQVFGHQLVERDGVSGGGPALVGTGRKDAALGRVAAGDPGMGGAGDDGEVLADVLQGLKVLGGLVITSGGFGHKVGIVQTEGEADADETFGLACLLHSGKGGCHRL